MNQGLRNVLAIALSMGVLILWFGFVAPPSKPQPAKSVAGQPQAVQKISEGEKTTLSNLSTAKQPFEKGKEIILENEFIRITLDTQGGRVTGWGLKKYKKNGGVLLAEGEGAVLNNLFQSGELHFPDPIPFTATRFSPAEVEFRWETKEGTLFKRVRLSKDDYQLDMEIEFANRRDKTIEFTPVVEWGKRASEESPQRGVLFFKTPPDKWHPVFYLDENLKATPWENVADSSLHSGNAGWIGAQSRYFLGAVMPVGTAGQKIEMSRYSVGNENFFLQKLYLPTIQVLPKERWSQRFKVFGGPKELKRLKGVGPGFEKAIGYGWTTVIAVPILYLLQLFYKVIHNYGISIILLTVLIKIVLNPINRKSLASMKGMQAIQPQLKELQAKLKNDKEKLNVEMMRLFKAHKINPMGGCLPMLLQIPIYIALYKVLWSSVELYQAPFFWFYKDLSAPDPYLITPIFLGITMLIQTKMTPSATADPTQQKMMMLMPIMFCAFMIFLPMGLGLYIFVNTVMTILQQWMYKNGIRTRDILLGRFGG